MWKIVLSNWHQMSTKQYIRTPSILMDISGKQIQFLFSLTMKSKRKLRDDVKINNVFLINSHVTQCFVTQKQRS